MLITYVPYIYLTGLTLSPVFSRRDGDPPTPHQALYYGKEEGYNAMTIDLLGLSLEGLSQTYGMYLSLKTVLQLGDQMLLRWAPWNPGGGLQVHGVLPLQYLVCSLWLLWKRSSSDGPRRSMAITL